MAQIKAYTKAEIASMYNITYKKLRAWLRPFHADIGSYNGKLYTPVQVKIIFEKLGEP